MAYATVDEYKEFVDSQGRTDDDRISTALDTASDQVDEATGRSFVDVGNESRTIVVDLPSITRVDLEADIYGAPTLSYRSGIGQAEQSLTVDEDYVLIKHDNRDPVYRVALFARPIRGLLIVEGTWGWENVPEAIKALTMISAAAIIMDSPIAFGGTEQGTETRTINEYVYNQLENVVNRYSVK